MANVNISFSDSSFWEKENTNEIIRDLPTIDTTWKNEIFIQELLDHYNPEAEKFDGYIFGIRNDIGINMHEWDTSFELWVNNKHRFIRVHNPNCKSKINAILHNKIVNSGDFQKFRFQNNANVDNTIEELAGVIQNYMTIDARFLKRDVLKGIISELRDRAEGFRSQGINSSGIVTRGPDVVQLGTNFAYTKAIMLYLERNIDKLVSSAPQNNNSSSNFNRNNNTNKSSFFENKSNSPTEANMTLKF